jgi:hypothetical protein
MAITIQVCAECKHERDNQSSLRVDGLVYQIFCPCACHTRVQPWY